jgi:hypothetical protein
MNSKNIESIRESHPGIYQRALNLMRRPEYKGVVGGMAIPDGTATPDWLIPFIDVKTIVNDNLNAFPLASTGLNKNGSYNNYSNIINI